MNGSTLLRGLRRRWALVVALTVLGLLAGAAAGLLRPQAVSTVTVLIGAVTDADRQEQLAQPERYVQRQVRIMLSQDVLEDASSALDDGSTARDLRAALAVDGGTVDDAVEVSASGTSSAQAEARAGAVVESYVEASGGVGRVLDRGVAEPVVAPVRATAAGGVLGLALGLLLVVLLLNARPRVTGWASLEGVPARVFPGSLPLRRRTRRDELDVTVLSLAAWLHRDEPAGHSLLVCGTRPGDAAALLPLLVDALRGIGRTVAVAPDDLDLPAKVGWLDQSEPGVVRLVAATTAIEEAALAGMAGGRVLLLVPDDRDQVSDVVAAAERIGGPERVRVAVVR